MVISNIPFRGRELTAYRSWQYLYLL